MVSATLTRDDVRRELASRSFVEFLDHVSIRSDDPENPGVAKWQSWPSLLERARSWEQGNDEVILKARQLGFTWLMAAYLTWRARNGAACAVFSVGQREAREVIRRIRYIEANLPAWMQDEPGGSADEVRYPSGGSVHAFPSTEHAGISYTFQVIAADEGAFHPYGAQNYAAYRPTISAGGQFLLFSTADPSLGPAGFFYDIYWASKRGETPYKAVFVPWDARPDRDEAWLANERSAFTGLPEEFDAYYPSSDAEAFVGRSGLVYGEFSTTRHVVSEHPWEWKNSVRKVAGVDFGGGDPTAVVILGMSGTHKVHQFGEFYQRGPVSVEDIANFISQWPGVGMVLCDPSEPVAIETLRRAGIAAQAANNKRGEGIGFTKWMLEKDRLSIHASCTNSIHEFPGYRWKEQTDPHTKERYATSTPVDHHADAMDARRYALLDLMAVIRRGPVVSSLTGRPRARSAA